jgi:hypothetical protein
MFFQPRSEKFSRVDLPCHQGPARSMVQMRLAMLQCNIAYKSRIKVARFANERGATMKGQNDTARAIRTASFLGCQAPRRVLRSQQDACVTLPVSARTLATCACLRMCRQSQASLLRWSWLCMVARNWPLSTTRFRLVETGRHLWVRGAVPGAAAWQQALQLF